MYNGSTLCKQGGDNIDDEVIEEKGYQELESNSITSMGKNKNRDFIIKKLQKNPSNHNIYQ
jgi:hypothetical protein